jgi:hypothetical protein
LNSNPAEDFKERVFAVNERKMRGKDEECKCSMAGQLRGWDARSNSNSLIALASEMHDGGGT